MAQISKIKFNDVVCDITVPHLECVTNELSERLKILETLTDDIYYNGHYTPMRKAIEELNKKIEYVERDLYNAITELYALIEQLRPESNAQTEKPKQKFDLEIFEAIEAFNPFLQNLK